MAGELSRQFLKLPVRLGKYQLLRHLATGGMAELYLARSRVTAIEGFEKILVVKRIRPELANDKEIVQLFLDEARLAAQLEHVNIAHVYDVGVVDQSYFFVMELIHGEDVSRILKTAFAKKTKVGVPEALSILTGACAGLHYAHEKRGSDGKPLHIVHRDVSPSNVLVTYDGSVKMCDFGIAKARTQSRKTRTGEVLGKVAYMSPEQCEARPLDRRSDVYSLGIVAYELTTGLKLYSGKSDYQVMRQICEKQVPPPSRLRDGYPLPLESVIMKALSKDPDARYASAQDMQIDLEAYALDAKLPVSPITLQRFMHALFGRRIEALQHALREADEAALLSLIAESIRPDEFTGERDTDVEVILPENRKTFQEAQQNDTPTLDLAQARSTTEMPSVMRPTEEMPAAARVTEAMQTAADLPRYRRPRAARRRMLLALLTGFAVAIVGGYALYRFVGSAPTKPAAETQGSHH